MSVFILGTCRLFNAGRMLSRMGVEMAIPRHRMLSPQQTLQFVQHMRGRPYWYGLPNIHLLSTEAADDIRAGRDPQEIVAELNAMRAEWNKHTAFIYEITYAREHLADFNGRRFALPRFIGERFDLPAETFDHTDAAVLDMMAQTRALLGGRPVIWVSHAPPDREGEPHLTALRNRLRSIIDRAAARFGELAVHPYDIVSEIGQDAFFKDWRNDTDHYKATASRRVAEKLRDALREVSNRGAGDLAPDRTVRHELQSVESGG